MIQAVNVVEAIKKAVPRGVSTVDDARRLTAVVVEAYWRERVEAVLGADAGEGAAFAVRPPFEAMSDSSPFAELKAVARLVGRHLAKEDVLEAGYVLGQVYTEFLPRSFRGRHGVYYTPPLISARLLDLVEDEDVRWDEVRVLDPACGGGAFLAPVARRMVRDLAERSPVEIVERVESALQGYEIDAFGGWLSQVMLDAEMLEVCFRAGRRLRPCVEIRDTLADVPDEQFDVVVGNPPYGKVRLSQDKRERYSRSLYGHANLYGLFTDQALRQVRDGGVIAFITPTSFLSGQYFKNLRRVLAAEAPPRSIAFVRSRARVFAGVLQEVALTTFVRRPPARPGRVSELIVDGPARLRAEAVGEFDLPHDGSSPWILPRSREQEQLVRALARMPHRLRDYGYRVKTGPLVWNRHDSQLSRRNGEGSFPLIWAEAVRSDGSFRFKADQRGGVSYFRFEPGDEWLLSREECVLVQRTTAKEQPRRIVAATLPASFIAEHGAVVVENHLNMVISTGDVAASDRPPMCSLTALLNSRTVDQAFRCMNGSVAVSAYELESLPLPAPEVLAGLAAMIDGGASPPEIEAYVERAYRDAASAGHDHVAGDRRAA